MADQDLWVWPEVKPEDSHKYYAYTLLYVDDILLIHHDAESCLKDIDNYFKMKADSIGDPDYYLGAELRPMKLQDGVTAWAMNSSKYVQAAVRNVKDFIKRTYPGRSLPKRVTAPFPTGYVLELDVTPELNVDHATSYQSQIGVLCWCV